ncbi:hypothetical protein PG990_001965 [Apiospora arundinis]
MTFSRSVCSSSLLLRLPEALGTLSTETPAPRTDFNSFAVLSLGSSGGAFATSLNFRVSPRFRFSSAHGSSSSSLASPRSRARLPFLPFLPPDHVGVEVELPAHARLLFLGLLFGLLLELFLALLLDLPFLFAPLVVELVHLSLLLCAPHLPA